MAIVTELPTWFEALRAPSSDGSSYGSLAGPPLGPALRDLLYGANAPKVDPMLLLWNMLTQVCSVAIPNAVGVGLAHNALFIPGHVGYKPLDKWNINQHQYWPSFPYGPSPGCADVVVVGKHPARDEEMTGYLFSGPSGVELKAALHEENIADFLDNAYFTNICRFQPPGGKFKQSFVKESAWFLWAEIAIIRPKMVVLLGGDAIKHFHGKNHSVQKSRGSVMPVSWESPTGDFDIDTFPTMHPAAVAREPVKRPGMAADLARCHSMLTGNVRMQMPTNYSPDWEPAVLRTVSDVRNYVETTLELGCTEFAIDCEWAGKSVWSDGQLLTIQLSRDEGHAVLIPIRRHPRIPFPRSAEPTAHDDLVRFKLPSVSEYIARGLECVDDDGEMALGYFLRDEKGLILRQAGVEVVTRLVKNFSDQDEAEVVSLLRRLLLRPGVKVGGHNFRADFPWIKAFGVDLTDQFIDGFDTMLDNHLLHESAEQTLTACILKYTSMDRYDVEIHDWLARRNLDVKNGGFGPVPEIMLYPYALRDADGTFRVYRKISEHMQDDGSEDRSALRVLSRVELRACMGILEVEETGMCVDRDRILELADVYANKREQLTAEIRQKLNWPEFNPRSVQQCKEMLFGEQFNGKQRDDPNIPVRIRPDGAYCANLTPIKTTDKPSMDWQRVVQEGGELRHSPSTDKETLGILGELDGAAELLRRIRFVDQVVKTYVSKPYVDPDTGEVIEGGLLQYIDDDGRIRTSIFQGTETGRWSSSRPNCFSGETEVLTNSGWCRLADYVRSDAVAQYDPETREISFVRPSHCVKYDGELMRITTPQRQIDMVVTPDHRCLVRRRKSGRCGVTPARQYPEDCCQIAAGSYVGGSGIRELTTAHVRFLAMVQADGHFVRAGGVELAFSKARKIARCREILDELGCDHRVSSDAKRTRFYLGVGNALFKLSVRYLSAQKRFGDWILQLSRHQLDVLVEEIWHWDGCYTRRSHYSSSDKINADWVQIAISLSGRRARIRPYAAKSGNTNWQVDISRRDYVMTTNRRISGVFDARVYCLTVDTGYLVTRHNGVVAVTGNCQNLPKRREPELHSYFDKDAVPHKVRSVFMAPPGWVLLESDYKQAELVVLALLSGDREFWNVLMARPLYPVLVRTDTGEPYRWLHPEWTRGFHDLKDGDIVPSGSRWGEYRDHDGAWKVFSTGEETRVEMREWTRDLHAEVAISGFRLPYTAVVHGPPRDWMEGYAKDKRVAAKCLDPDTVVFTDRGLATVRDLKSLPKVWTGDRYVDCLSTTSYSANRVLLVTRHGCVRCTEDHRFVGPDGGLVEARQLKKGDILPMPSVPPFRESDDQVVRVNPFTKEVGSGPAAMSLGCDWGYFAGLVQGDGSRIGKRDGSSPQYVISHGHTEAYVPWAEEIVKAGERLGIPMVPSGTAARPDRTRRVSKIVGQYLDALGLGGVGGKHLRVPWWVLRGSKDTALSYLAGLFDTDGTIAPNEGRSPNAKICTRDAVFAGQLVCLVRSLGACSSIHLSWNETYRRNYYTVTLPSAFLRLYRDFPLRCPRKKERWASHCDRMAVSPPSVKPTWPNEVLLVETVAAGEVMDVEIDHPSHLYVQGGLLGHNTVNFGIPYGRSAGAIARELRQEGVHVSVDETQDMIDNFLSNYPRVAEFLDICRYNVSHPFYGAGNGYLVTPFGRRRRFQQIDDQAKMAAQEREACNFPIQSTVADCLNLAIFNAWAYRRCAKMASALKVRNEREQWLKNRYVPLDYRIVLGVHDALLFYAKPASLRGMLQPGGMIDMCMSDQARVPLPHKGDCHGLYKNIDDSKFPYAIGVDKGISLRWDDTPDKKWSAERVAKLQEDMRSIGVPEEYIPGAK